MEKEGTTVTTDKHLPASRQIVPLLILVLAILSLHNAHAEGLSLIFNGRSFHLEQPIEGGRFKENNWGLGLQYDMPVYKEKWLPYLTASGFKDSRNHNSFYAGGGMMRRYLLSDSNKGLYFGAGLVAFVMVRKDYHDRRPFLGALPAFTLGMGKIAINATYIPKVEPKMVPLWFFQLKISLED